MSAQLSMEEAKEYNHIPFKVKREKWARYQLEDNTILKVKLVLVNVKTNVNLADALAKMQKTKKKIPIGMHVQIRSVIGVEVPPNLRREPDNKKYSPSELANSVVQEDLEFKRLDQTTWISEYELEGKVELKVQITLIDVARTNKYDNTGEPYYLVSSTADVKVVLPKKYRETRKIKPSVERRQ